MAESLHASQDRVQEHDTSLLRRRSLASDLSMEILQLIFDRTITPSCFIGPGYSVCEYSWLAAMAEKRNLPLVCRSWYHASIELLYRDIGIRSVGQVCALAKTIEGTPSLAPLVRSITFACFVGELHELTYTWDAGTVMKSCQNLHRAAFVAHSNYHLGLLLPVLHRDYAYPTNITHLDLDIQPSCEAFLSGCLPDMYRDSPPPFATLNMENLFTIEDFSLRLVELNLPLLTDITRYDDLSFPLLTTLSFAVNSWDTRRNVSQLARSWQTPALEYMTVTCVAAGPSHLNAMALMGNGMWLQPLLAVNGPHLRYLHIRAGYSFGFICDFTLDIKPMLDACPLLDHIVLPPHAKVPHSHPSLRWIDVWEPPLLGQVSLESMDCSIRELRSGLQAPAEPSEARAIQADLPRLCGIRTIDYALFHLRNLPKILAPIAWTNTDAAFVYPGVHIMHSSVRVWRGDLDPQYVGEEEDATSPEREMGYQKERNE
ncbi:hypothetical protein K525DRAFT_290177 [Schizophyllum commune Loenen D]|nr:hypothetical protein K525DRAFT_290177 [Schizophyllum commune Loenen D]